MSVRALCTLALFCSGLASRDGADSVKLESSESSASFGADTYAGRAGTRGQVLHGRYRLEEFIERSDLRVSTHDRKASIFADVQENVSDMSQGWLYSRVNAGSFPETLRKRFTNANMIRHGGFDEAWSAEDTKMDKRVVVFFPMTNNGQYMTGRDASWSGYLDGKQNECALVQEMLESNSAKEDDKEGASHICRCLEHNFGTAGRSERLYFVLEDCGRTVDTLIARGERPLEGWELASQLLQGLRFLESRKLIHHNLKPSNVCINRDKKVKIIGWRHYVNAEPDKQKLPAVGTAFFQPPEIKEGLAFAFPSYTYDVYSVGLIFLDYICGVQAHMLLVESGNFELAIKSCKSKPWEVDRHAIERMTAADPTLRPDPETAERELKKRELKTGGFWGRLMGRH